MADDQTTQVAPPAPPPNPSAAPSEGFLHSLATSLGIDPEAVKTAAKSILAHPIETAKAVGSEAASEISDIAKHPTSSAKETGEGVAATLGVNPTAQETAKQRFAQPGIGNKAAGALEYLTSGVPLVGGNLVKAEEQGAQGNAAGSLGTTIGTVAPFLTETEGAQLAKEHIAETAKTAAASAKEGLENAVNAKAPEDSLEAGFAKLGGKKVKGSTTEPQSLSPLPPQPKLPDTGQYAAIQTDDGAIYPDTEPEKQRTHIMLAKDLGIPPERVVSGGWLKDGDYEGSPRSDAGRWGEQARARARVEAKKPKSQSLGAAAAIDFAPVDGQAVRTPSGQDPYVYHATDKSRADLIRQQGIKGPNQKVAMYANSPDEALRSGVAPISGNRADLRVFAVPRADVEAAQVAPDVADNFAAQGAKSGKYLVTDKNFMPSHEVVLDEKGKPTGEVVKMAGKQNDE